MHNVSTLKSEMARTSVSPRDAELFKVIISHVYIIIKRMLETCIRRVVFVQLYTTQCE